MSKLFILVFSSTILFASNIFVGVDMSYDLEAEISGAGSQYNGSYNLTEPDDAAVTIGYNHALSNTLDLGISFMVNPMVWDGEVDITTGLHSSEDKAGFISIYLRPKFDLSKDVDFWLDIGINRPTEDLADDDFDDGLMYGVGLNFDLKGKLGLSFGYHIHQTSIENNGVELEYDVGRSTLYLTYDVE